MKKFKLISFIAVLIFSITFVSFLYFTPKIQAQNTPSAVSGTATITNMGYLIYFSGLNGGTSGNIPFSVERNPSTGAMSGYAWSPEYGWIQFAGNTATVLSLVGINDTETPNDWANGLIKLNGTDGGTTMNISYSVTFDPLTGLTTSHWAWGGNVLGWIDFSNVLIGVSTGPSNCTLTATPIAINSGGSALLFWYGTNLASCTASGDWSGSQPISGGPINTGVLTTSKTYNLSCLGTNGVNVVCSASVNVDNICHDSLASNFGGLIPCEYTPSCPPGWFIQDGICVSNSPDYCLTHQTEDQCYCPQHPTENPRCTNIDHTGWCDLNPTLCKKPPKFIEN